MVQPHDEPPRRNILDRGLLSSHVTDQLAKMKLYRFVLGVLAVWRITHLLQAEDGPWDILVRLRRFAGENFWGNLLDCFYCLSLWLAAPLAVLLGQTWWERALLWPSLSAGASLLEKATNPALRIPAAPFVEHPPEDN
jgi:hypothetical protein